MVTEVAGSDVVIEPDATTDRRTDRCSGPRPRGPRDARGRPQDGRAGTAERDRVVGHQLLVEPLEQHLAAELAQEMRLAIVHGD